MIKINLGMLYIIEMMASDSFDNLTVFKSVI